MPARLRPVAILAYSSLRGIVAIMPGYARGVPSVLSALIPVALFVGVSLLVACEGRTFIRLPNTPEARACKRECMSIYNQCVAGQVGISRLGSFCASQSRECRLSCPGAQEVKEPWSPW